jgi:putative ABC transport system permease protein
LIVRSTGDPLALTSSIRAAIATVDPDVPLAKIRTMSDLITKKFGVRRLGVVLVGFFSGATLLLSAIGLYGLLAYAVSRRTREIGIRIAVGARSTNILQLVIRRGLKLAGTGLLIGVVATLALSRLIGSLLYGVSATDPLSLIIAILVLGLAALLACLLPAFRATRIDPITALRE